MPELHLRDTIVGTYSACGTFTKHMQRIQEFFKYRQVKLYLQK